MGKHTNNPLLISLFIKQNAQCYYCGCLCSVVYQKNNRGWHKKNGATIEHIYSKMDIRRYAVGGDSAKVMACFTCNQKKNTADQLLTSEKEDKTFSLIKLIK